MISVEWGGRLANHLWQYAVCRTVAEYKNYEFHIPRDFLGSEFFDCSLGVEEDLTKEEFRVDEGGEIQAYNPEIWNIKDFTKLQGHLQTEKYIINNKQNIQKWFVLKKQNKDLLDHIGLDNNTCVIHLRGDDYKTNPAYLPKKYYDDAIKHMLDVNPKMKFVVVTDDPAEALRYFPEFPVYSNAPIDDFYILNQARYLIIASSTFSWWATWLNDNCRFVIAPKYWFRYNTWNQWCLKDSITTGFYYVDRAGDIFSSNQCLKELKD